MTDLGVVLTWLGRLLAVGSLIFLGYLCWHYRNDIVVVYQRLPVLVVLAVVAVYLLNHVVAVLVLRSLLGVETRLPALLRVQALSQLAKYLPGNVFHYVGRVAMASEIGVSPARMSAVSLVEVAVVVFSGVLVVLIGMAGVSMELIPILRPVLIGLGTTGLLLALFCSLPLAPNPAWRGVELRQLARAVVVYVLVFQCLGIALWLVFQSMGKTGLALAVVANTTAWLSGFLVPGAPGGLGIREAITFQFYAASFDEATVVFVVLAMRFLALAADSLFFLVGLWLKRRAT